jgi:exonuclease 3'-5' domain-containing protein 2
VWIFNIVARGKMAHQKLQARKRKIYDNCSIYSPDNVLMCYCSRRRIDFYLKNDLAVKIDDNSIKLKFIPHGLGHNNEHPYLLEIKKNQCVVCGTEKGLTRHHVVPHAFRVHIQSKFYLRFGHYDVLPLCVICHGTYDTEHQTPFVKKLFDEHEIKFESKVIYNKDIGKIVKSAYALINHKDTLPEDKKVYLEGLIKEYYGIELLTDEIIINATKIENWKQKKDWESPYKQLLNKYETNEFFILWRKHFVKAMKPKFLLKSWAVDVKFVIDNENDLP